MLWIMTFISSLIFPFSNYLTQLLWFWREISQIAWDLIITPSGYAFSIRFPIFVWSIVFGWYAMRWHISKQLMKKFIAIFLLTALRTVLVSFTDLFWLPPIVFVLLSVLLLSSVKKIESSKFINKKNRYRLVVVPLLLFVGWANSAFWLNIATAVQSYNLPINQMLLSWLILSWLLIWHYWTIWMFKLPRPTILTYLWATVWIIVALIVRNSPRWIICLSVAHAVWLIVVAMKWKIKL